MLRNHNNAAILQRGYYQLIGEKIAIELCENGQSLSATGIKNPAGWRGIQ
jgi:hypothetical protein